MKWFLFRVAIVLLIIGIFSLMPALLLWFLGVNPRANWNADSIKTTCTILNTTVNRDQCSYSCNCRQSSCSYVGNVWTCNTYCDTCYYTCYYGLLNVSYDVTYSGTYTGYLRVLDREPDVTSAQYDLNKYYPIGSSVFCYYAQSNPSDVRLYQNSYAVFLAFFVIFVIIGGIMLVGWLIIEGCLFRDHHKRCGDCDCWDLLRSIKNFGRKPDMTANQFA